MHIDKYTVKRNIEVIDKLFLEGDVIYISESIHTMDGVLEHFSNNDIHKILSRQKQEASYVVHYVPTDGYTNPSFGDERLMSVEWWVNEWLPTEHLVFNEGKDLVLIWEK